MKKTSLSSAPLCHFLHKIPISVGQSHVYLGLYPELIQLDGKAMSCFDCCCPDRVGNQKKLNCQMKVIYATTPWLEGVDIQ
jgi:hypothetical protein